MRERRAAARLRRKAARLRVQLDRLGARARRLRTKRERIYGLLGSAEGPPARREEGGAEAQP